MGDLVLGAIWLPVLGGVVSVLAIAALVATRRLVSPMGARASAQDADLLRRGSTSFAPALDFSKYHSRVRRLTPQDSKHR